MAVYKEALLDPSINIKKRIPVVKLEQEL